MPSVFLHNLSLKSLLQKKKSNKVKSCTSSTANLHFKRYHQESDKATHITRGNIYKLYLIRDFIQHKEHTQLNSKKKVLKIEGFE